MRTIIRYSSFLKALVWLALSCALLPARAGVADAPGANLRVDLYTYGPGAIYWERFGHDALVITDTASGEAYAFNYGMFDFDQKDFYLNFARGIMIYRAAAWPAAEDIQQFSGEGRSITDQHLNLTPAQRAQLRDFLVWNVQPEHSRYRYRYFTDNCTTRVRDALDRVLGGALQRQLTGPAARGETYRSETDRLMSGQPWLMYLLDLGLGPFADQPLTRWTGAFIPARLMHELRSARASDGAPLVQSETVLSPQRLPSPPAAPPDIRWPLLIAGMVLGAALVASAWLRDQYAVDRWWFALVGSAYALLAGLAGALMLVLWLATAHRAAWSNENLWLFNPLAWLLIPGLLRVRKPGATCSRFTLAVGALLALLALWSLVSKLMPAFPQRNLPWILFALPAWLGVLAGAWLMRDRTPRARPR
ncbi:MAG: lipoprotein N-acyltransferase Lnb domain-containing protein [Rhodanobacteraceae bacterium]